jgi:ATP-dependent DNA ligase
MERAKTISVEYTKAVNEEYNEWIANGQNGSWRTPSLYKERGGTAESWMTIQWNDDALKEKLLLTRTVINPGKSPQDYTTEIKGTKTLHPIDRVITEVEKRTTKKLRDAWVENEDDLKGDGAVSAATLKKPMLLHKYEQHMAKMDFPCVAQPKFDGVRVYYDHEAGHLFTRTGKRVPMPHLEKQLSIFGLDLDGELCFNNLTTPLQEIIHAKAHRDPELCFHIFDAPTAELDYTDRFLKKIKNIIEVTQELPNVFVVQTTVCTSHLQVDELYKALTAIGAEGLVVRNIKGTYNFGKRSYEVLKYKREFEEFYSTGSYVIDEHPKYPDGLVKFICKMDDGGEFEVVPAWTHDERAEFVKKVEIKGMTDLDIEVEHRGLTKDGKPAHAVGKTSYKDMMAQLEG